MRPFRSSLIPVAIILCNLPALGLIHAPGDAPAPPRVLDDMERLATQGPMIVRVRAEGGLAGDFDPGQPADWVAAGLVMRSAGNGPYVRTGEREPGGLTFSQSIASAMKDIPKGVRVAEVKPVVSPSGRVLYPAPDGQNAARGNASDFHDKVALAWGGWAMPPAEVTYDTLLRQPLLDVLIREVVGPSVPKGWRRFDVGATVRMAVPDASIPAGSREGPIDTVYAESTTVDVQVGSAYPSGASERPDVDLDLDAAMRNATPKVLDGFAVRMGAARLLHRHDGLVGAPGLDESGKAQILRDGSGPLKGWRKSKALPFGPLDTVVKPVASVSAQSSTTSARLYATAR